MSESTLSVQFNQLNSEVGWRLGFGRGSVIDTDPTWDARQTSNIASVIKSGYRNVLLPPANPDGSVYDWSFLRPVATLTLLSAANTITLADDFGQPEGRAVVTSPASTIRAYLDFQNEGRINEEYARFPDATGRPQMVALQIVKGTGASAGQRFKLYFFPTADQDYTVKVAYYVDVDALTSGAPFPYGGMPMGELILQSCLAVAEQRMDNTMGPMTVLFKERLAAAIAADRRSKPQNLGYNGDRSDGLDTRYPPLHGETVVSFSGITYP